MTLILGQLATNGTVHVVGDRAPRHVGVMPPRGRVLPGRPP